MLSVSFSNYKSYTCVKEKVIFQEEMTEEARKSILSLTNSMLDEASGNSVNMSFADDEICSVNFDDSVFSAIDLSTNTDAGSSVENVSKTALEITNSVSDKVDTLEDDGAEREKLNDTLKAAYSTCMRRFERAIGHRMINNDVIKLQPVS